VALEDFGRGTMTRLEGVAATSYLRVGLAQRRMKARHAHYDSAATSKPFNHTTTQQQQAHQMPTVDTTAEDKTNPESRPVNARAERGVADLEERGGHHDRGRNAFSTPSATFPAAAVQLSSPWRRAERGFKPRRRES
jgi:hypothetical protein